MVHYYIVRMNKNRMDKYTNANYLSPSLTKLHNLLTKLDVAHLIEIQNI